jgi:hypothetical protein
MSSRIVMDLVTNRARAGRAMTALTGLTVLLRVGTRFDSRRRTGRLLVAWAGVDPVTPARFISSNTQTCGSEASSGCRQVLVGVGS